LASLPVGPFPLFSSFPVVVKSSLVNSLSCSSPPIMPQNLNACVGEIKPLRSRGGSVLGTPFALALNVRLGIGGEDFKWLNDLRASLPREVRKFQFAVVGPDIDAGIRGVDDAHITLRSRVDLPSLGLQVLPNSVRSDFLSLCGSLSPFDVAIHPRSRVSPALPPSPGRPLGKAPLVMLDVIRNDDLDHLHNQLDLLLVVHELRDPTDEESRRPTERLAVDHVSMWRLPNPSSTSHSRRSSYSTPQDDESRPRSTLWSLPSSPKMSPSVPIATRSIPAELHPEARKVMAIIDEKIQSYLSRSRDHIAGTSIGSHPSRPPPRNPFPQPLVIRATGLELRVLYSNGKWELDTEFAFQTDVADLRSAIEKLNLAEGIEVDALSDDGDAPSIISDDLGDVDEESEAPECSTPPSEPLPHAISFATSPPLRSVPLPAIGGSTPRVSQGLFGSSRAPPPTMQLKPPVESVSLISRRDDKPIQPSVSEPAPSRDLRTQLPPAQGSVKGRSWAEVAAGPAKVLDTFPALSSSRVPRNPPVVLAKAPAPLVPPTSNLKSRAVHQPKTTTAPNPSSKSSGCNGTPQIIPKPQLADESYAAVASRYKPPQIISKRT
jgi:hypothetical protein